MNYKQKQEERIRRLEDKELERFKEYDVTGTDKDEWRIRRWDDEHTNE